MTKKDAKIEVKGMKISLLQKDKDDYISLTDIARYKNQNEIDHNLQNWMRNLKTLEFLGLWEKINNSNFKPLEFEGFKSKAGIKSFSITPKYWIEHTNAIGLISKSGRYGGGQRAILCHPALKRLKN